VSNPQDSWFGEEALLRLRRQEDPRATYATDFGPDLRAASSGLFARYFLVHLHAELLKSDETLQQDYADIPAREVTEGLLARVRREFAIPDNEPLPEQNLFKVWVELEDKHKYEELAFIGYSHIYFHRLLDMRDGTPESLEKLLVAMRAVFDKFDYKSRSLPISLFLHLENLMRELMRHIIHERLPQFRPEGEDLVVLQSRAYQRDMYEYFEGVLDAALAENVRLLHGILPEEVATELKRNGHVAPNYIPDAAVIFTDFEHFSASAERLSPAEIVQKLDTYFSEFDAVMTAHSLEKIKTIGDSYMAVAGVPQPHPEPVRAACDAALGILEVAERISGADGWKIRIGIHIGPLVAGVIGKQKFSYDVWGSTVNFASRMESSGAPGRINVSAAFHTRAPKQYRWEARGTQPVKGLGAAEMYFLLGKEEIEVVFRQGSSRFTFERPGLGLNRGRSKNHPHASPECSRKVAGSCDQVFSPARFQGYNHRRYRRRRWRFEGLLLQPFSKQGGPRGVGSGPLRRCDQRQHRSRRTILSARTAEEAL
jgi:class 3 adenylate cyclase